MLEKAKQCAGNHKSFNNFSWFNEPENSQNIMLYPLKTRDSNLVEQSNAKVFEKELIQLGVTIERFNHFACGWVENLVIPVFDGEQTEENITPAFKKFIQLTEKMQEYPILDEMDYLDMEYTDTIANIMEEGQIDEKTAIKVHAWMMINYPEQIKPIDGFGGYPDEDFIKEAIQTMEEK